MADNDPTWINRQSDSKDEGGNVSEAMMQRPQLAELLALALNMYSRFGALSASTNTNDSRRPQKA